MIPHDKITAAVREGWPERGTREYEGRGFAEIPPVREGGMTAYLIDYAVETTIAHLFPTVNSEGDLDALPSGSVISVEGIEETPVTFEKFPSRFNYRPQGFWRPVGDEAVWHSEDIFSRPVTALTVLLTPKGT